MGKRERKPLEFHHSIRGVAKRNPPHVPFTMINGAHWAAEGGRLEETNRAQGPFERVYSWPRHVSPYACSIYAARRTTAGHIKQRTSDDCNVVQAGDGERECRCVCVHVRSIMFTF